MAIIGFPEKPIRAFGNNQGIFRYTFTTAGGSNPSVASGDTDLIASNVYGATGIYTITFKKRFTSANVQVSMAGVAVTDTVHITSKTFGRNAACVLVINTAQSLAAHAFTGPTVDILMVITP